jgi:hypothetical protein
MKTPFIAATLALTTLIAQAGPLEDGFRRYIDRFKSSGNFPAALGDPRVPEVTQPQLTKRVDSLPLGTGRYVVFVTAGCHSCAAAAARIKAHTGGTAEVLDLGTSATAREAFALIKAKGVPAILMERHLLTGYTPQAFDHALADIATQEGQSMQGQGS